jgi:iron complex outermembrane receptor protein
LGVTVLAPGLRQGRPVACCIFATIWQKFRGFSLHVPNIVYNNVLPGQDPATGSPTTFSFTTSVGALVKGFDVDTAFQITPEWRVSAQASYADGKVTSGQAPCNITGAGGAPVFNTGGLISLCQGGAASRLPFWKATVQSEYAHPVAENMDGFVRLLATYYPENKNRAEPNFTVDKYALVNVYAGVRSHDGAWEASLFVRNAFDVTKATDISTVQANLGQSLPGGFATTVNHPTGYFETITTNPREVGINVHYAWGGR